MPSIRPKGFAPGAALDRLANRILREAGFEPGFPLFGGPDGSNAETLQGIMHALTYPEYAGGSTLHPLPIMPLHALVPEDSGRGKTRNTPMEVSEIRRVWGGIASLYWRLDGRLDYDRNTKWFIDRKRVVDCHIHLLLKDDATYLQLVPIGTAGQRLPPTTNEHFQWGDLSSRTLPPKRNGV
jgi:hypothetical protein